MEMRQLEMLCAVVDHKGYAQAGEHLHIAHSAIHRQIRSLEDEIGQKIFSRHGHTVQLTEAGQLLVTFAKSVRQDFKIAEQQIRDIDALTGGQLRVGTGANMLNIFLPAVLGEFHLRYPGLEIEVISSVDDRILSDIQEGSLEVGLTSEPPSGYFAAKHLCYEHLYDEELELVVSKHHRFASRNSVAWSELENEPFIAFMRNTRLRRLIDSCFKDEGVSPKVVMELESEEVVGKMIEIGFGIGFLAKRRINSDILHGVRVGESKIVLSVAAVYNDIYVPRRVAEFLRTCRERPSLSI